MPPERPPPSLKGVAAPGKSFVWLTLLGCALGAVCRLQQQPVRLAELTAQELVRVRGGIAVVVLFEKDGGRLLPVQVTRGEAAAIERRLQHGPAGDLLGSALQAVGGRIVRAQLDDVDAGHAFHAHLIVAAAGGREVALEASAGEAVAAALSAGAPIVADPAVLDAAAVTADEVRSVRSVQRAPVSSPAPVQHI